MAFQLLSRFFQIVDLGIKGAAGVVPCLGDILFLGLQLLFVELLFRLRFGLLYPCIIFAIVFGFLFRGGDRFFEFLLVDGRFLRLGFRLSAGFLASLLLFLELLL